MNPINIPILLHAGVLASGGPACAATPPHPFGRSLIPDLMADAGIFVKITSK